MMNYLARKLILIFSLIILAPAMGWTAGLHFGLPSAVRSEIKKLKAKIDDANKAAALVVAGNVVKGPVAGATVTLYVLNPDGTMGPVLGTSVTNSSGAFSITAGISGPFLAVASGGSYINEVSGLTETLTASDLLSAALPAGTTLAAITPYTHMAATLARALAAAGTPLPAAVDSANSGVAQQFNLGSLTGVLPAAANNSAATAGASLPRRSYGLLAAALAQEAATLNVSPSALAAALANDMKDGILNGLNGTVILTVPTITGGTIILPPTAGTTGLQTALDTFLASPGNKTNITEQYVSGTAMQVGATPASPLYVTTPYLPYWIEGQTGSMLIKASGGSGAYTCALKTGSTLPVGWTLVNCSVTGLAPVLAGGTTLRISPPFSIVVTDTQGHTQTVEYRITTTKAAPTFTTVAGSCIKGQACNIALVNFGSVTGGTAPYYYVSDSFANGTPPFGTVIGLNGYLTGVPASKGTYTFGVCAVDLVGLMGCKPVTVTVNDPSPTNGRYAGTWVGTFYYAVHGYGPGPEYQLYDLPNESFTMTVTLGAGMLMPGEEALMPVTSVTCSDPAFGATTAVTPDQSLSQVDLPLPFGSTSVDGQGFGVWFTNDSVIFTAYSDGAFTVSSDGRTISSASAVSTDAFSASTAIGDSNTMGSGPGGWPYNWCTFKSWTFVRQ